jgi:hypothetical protein
MMGTRKRKESGIEKMKESLIVSVLAVMFSALTAVGVYAAPPNPPVSGPASSWMTVRRRSPRAV